MSLHEGLDTRRVTSSNRKKGHGYASWTRPVSMNTQHHRVGRQKVCAALLLRRTSLVRNVGQCAQLRNCQSNIITRRSSIATIVLQLLSVEILSLRAESWSFDLTKNCSELGIVKASSFGMFIDFSLSTGSSANWGQVLLAVKTVHSNQSRWRTVGVRLVTPLTL